VYFHQPFVALPASSFFPLGHVRCYLFQWQLSNVEKKAISLLLSSILKEKMFFCFLAGPYADQIARGKGVEL
jgi:hypothetical protein